MFSVQHQTLVCLTAGAILACVYLVRWVFFPRRRFLPPSPAGNWLLGNMRLMRQPYRAIAVAADHDILTLVTPFEKTVIINTIDLATELLDKQSMVTADRPTNFMASQLMGWNNTLSFSPHGPTHKKLRRIITSALNPSVVRTYAPQQRENVAELIEAIKSESAPIVALIDKATRALIMRIAYGYTLLDNDPFIEITHQAMHYLAIGSMSHFWVNWFPILRYIPSWFPGAGFKQIGEQGKTAREKYNNDPFQPVLESVASGYVTDPSFTSRVLEEKGGVDASSEDIDLVKVAGAAFYLAGTTTTSSVLATFVLMMALYPELAQQAQNQIDLVAPSDQMPELGHQDQLPFVDALIQETMRIFPAVPLGLPHSATEDIEFHGYHIPKGTTINANIWAMLHDPRIYADPHLFNPTRFLKANPDPDPRKYVFGFGRRACPGLHLANNSIWLTCAGLLWAFDITPSQELLNRVAEIGGRDSPRMHELYQSFGVSVGPLPFSCHFKPRR